MDAKGFGASMSPGRRLASAGQSADASLHEDIVRRTNELFVKLNITTRPIQAFEELQKSASSMFVAIFETLFNVRLKNVIRKPRVVTDYITNAELVMTALSESLPLDLSFLSGEAIYRGDPHQIDQMLKIFESLWAQLCTPAELNAPVPPPVSPPHMSPTKRFQRAATPSFGSASSPFSETQQQAGEESPKHRPQPKRIRRAKKVGRNIKKKQQRAMRTAAVRTQIQDRKARQRHHSPTHGSKKFRKTAELLQKSFSDPVAFSKLRAEVDRESLEILAEEYPTVFRDLKLERDALGRLTSRPPTASNAVVKRIEQDLERYKKSYQLLLKEYEADVRVSTMKAKRKAELSSRGLDLDRRTEKARTRRMKKELDDLDESFKLKRKTREEVMVRNLFSNAVKLERDYLLAVKEQEAEDKAREDQERLNRYESIENYYTDRENMLRDTMKENTRNKLISTQARRVALKQLENRLRDEYKLKLDVMTSQWEHEEEHDLFKSEEQLSQVFEEMNEDLVSSVRNAMHAT